MVTAQYRLLTEGLGVNHLRLVIGTSMGGMHAWLWGEMYPDFVDALMPLASLPGQISGRNRMWRRIAIDAIRNDPAWQGGHYTAQPGGLRVAAGMLALVGSNPVLRQRESPTLAAADRWFTDYVDNYVQHRRRQRRPVRARGIVGLRPRAGPRPDHGAASGRELRGRPRQSA